MGVLSLESGQINESSMQLHIHDFKIALHPKDMISRTSIYCAFHFIHFLCAGARATQIVAMLTPKQKRAC